MESQITTYNPVNTQINNAVRCWQWEDVWEKWEGFRLEEFGKPVCTTPPHPTKPLLKELLSNVYIKVARAASCGRANFPGLMAGLLFIDPGSKLEDWVET